MSRFDSFQNLNGPRRLNRLVQVLLFAALIFGLNRLGYTHYTRVHTDGPGLSSESLSRLRQLRAQPKPTPVTFTVTFTENSSIEGEPELARHLRSLLADFEEHSKVPPSPENTKGLLVTSTFFDPYRNRAEVDKLINQHELSDSKFVIARCGENVRILRTLDLTTFKDGKAVSYKCEQALLNALMQVAWPQERSVYFTAGHDEMKLSSPDEFRGLTGISQMIGQRNLTPMETNLALLREIPANAAALIIAAPRKPFTPSEVDLIRRYLERAGRVLVFCDGPNPHGLDRLFAEWGIRADDMVVLENSPSHLANGRDLLISEFGDKHPTTQFLLDNKLPIYAGISRPVRPDPSLRSPLVSLTPLLRTSDQAWGEAAYRERSTWTYNSEADLRPPVSLAVAAERRPSDRLGVNLRGGRLVVFGFGDLIANHRLGNAGNSTLFHSLLQWCTEDQPDLLTPPRPVSNVQISASRDQLNGIAGLLGAIPGSVALLGLVVYWLRRS